MTFDDSKIEEILLAGNYVTADDIQKAKTTIGKTGTGLIDYLSQEGLISHDLFGQAMSEYFEVPYADLNSKVPAKTQVLKIPAEIAKKFRLILFQ